MKGLKNRHIVSQPGQVSGTGQPCGAGADHSHFFPLFLLGSLRLYALLPGVICHKALQFSDGYWLSLDAPDAFALTLALLGTHPSAHGGQGAGLTNGLVSPLHISVFHLLHKARNVDRHGTALDALRILAVNAAGRLLHGLFSVVSQTYFFKILPTCLRILFPHRHFLQNIHLYSPI